ncbi:MAG: type IX secretion system outer membrane channel protein PorV [Bacteroidia bacterium]|nr:type IX secretion system outer membrane channel protein PorV [Bacteroidia bacterium]MBP9689328.1 type IX secretion system outer membrane channel protein PorV [Bacteroidia bacterium]
MKKYFKGIAAVIISFSAMQTKAQITTGQLDGRRNTITSAVPFLLITPNARAGGMGDAGVATPNDPNAIHWNSAKMVFNEKNGTVSLSYNPWLRQLVPDVSLSYLSIMGKINDKASIGGSLRYFSLGEIQFTDVYGGSLGKATPSEWAADLAYAQKLSDNFSLGVAFRFIYSNIAGGAQTQSQSGINAGTSYSADITSYYKNKTKVQGYKVNYGIGAAITNIGSKLTYTTDQNQNFIPINLRIGGYGELEIDKYNTIALALDFNKLMIPTPPVYKVDSSGNYVYENGAAVIESGSNANVPIIQGMLQSFSDAPGGFKEELNEINISTGLEYWYDKQFAIRAGYFYENQYKGNRKYATFGIGIRYNVFTIDAAYLISFGQRNPLDNTLRFTLGLDFDALKSGSNEKEQPTGIFEMPKDN